ncbi:VRR-NUC domain-containing protein [Noviherbaspirillum sp.]|uniref:VRR-NUC domain-containing protein n=1 Tax=Noviherbaspirillum sp. TaxID=1926288 RepID=UPI002FDF7711
MPHLLDNPFYYLDNFHQIVEWVRGRYSHLLSHDEHRFVERLVAMPQASRALLVRMVMRKGPVFRASRLCYDEIGCARTAVRPLVEQGWVSEHFPLSLDQVFSLLTKSEVLSAFRLPRTRASEKKAALLDALRPEYSTPRCFAEWYPESDDCAYQVMIEPLCERLKLMYFGNCAQDWSEFTLSDLGINKYETVDLTMASHAFQSPEDIDCYLRLHKLRERLEAGEAAGAVLSDMPDRVAGNDWLESRRARLLLMIAQQQERDGETDNALLAYSSCAYPGARIRVVRILERSGKIDLAYALAQEAERKPESEAELQQLMRILPRLQRKLGLEKIGRRAIPAVDRIDLTLVQPAAAYSVELLVAGHLAAPDAPVFYVENTLINSLFGLLCWTAIFAPLPGAFFHPFHSGPADLYRADFHQRREHLFATCLAQLDSDEYRQTIRHHFAVKWGLQSPFVSWGNLSVELLNLTLDCIPASHLKKLFERKLLDIKANRAGLPDLIQFWPAERRYRMIEVKAPNDRLQDNQVRWLEYCVTHEIPVGVCYVDWMKEPA